MKWWTFNEQQLDAALARYVEETTPAGEDYREAAKKVAAREIKAFLESEAAIAHKLRGDVRP